MFLNLNLWSLSLLKWDGLRVSRCYWQQASYAVLNGAGYHCCHNMAAAGSLVLLALMVSNPHRAVIRLSHVVLPFASSHLLSVVAIKAFLWSKTLENVEGNLEGFCLIRCICGFTSAALTVGPWELVIISLTDLSANTRSWASLACAGCQVDSCRYTQTHKLVCLPRK